MNRLKSLRFGDKGRRAPTHTPMERPRLFRDGNGQVVSGLKVDEARLDGRRLHVNGWSVGPFPVSLQCNGRTIAHQCRRSSRPDVANGVGLIEPDEGFGFELIAEVPDGLDPRDLRMRWLASDGTAQQNVEFGVAIAGVTAVAAAGAISGKNVKGRSQQADPNVAAAHIDQAGAIAGGVGLVAGWAVGRPDVELWAEDSQGNRRRLSEAICYQRADIVKMFSDRFGPNTVDAGFVLDWPFPQQRGEGIRILADDGKRVNVIAETKWTDVPDDPVGYARWAFAVQTPPELFNERLERGEGRLIEDLIARRNANLKHADRPVASYDYGAIPAEDVEYSVIVPLYGRWDFVEHQLLEFSRDPIFEKRAELIYVIDDPALVTPLVNEAENLINLYRVPFRLIWGHRNRGFSGANNLGVTVARGEKLIFLNSDAFPCEPGWMEKLGESLDSNPEFGVVGPRLLFPDGGIQHVGMAFHYSQSWEVWLNKHPMIGLDPSIDDAVGLTERPAVTGACVAMRRATFERIGGFDEGYLIGDFEDSDLCLKVHSAELKTGYLPTVELVHLERQSFQMLGDGSFRTLVVRFNAWRHHQRWSESIARIMSEYGA